jgi:hypothetical protein
MRRSGEQRCTIGKRFLLGDEKSQSPCSKSRIFIAGRDAFYSYVAGGLLTQRVVAAREPIKTKSYYY